MPPKTRRIIGRSLCGLLLLLGACTRGSSSAGPGAPELGVESGLPDHPQPRRGGHLVYGLEAETDTGWCLSSATLAISGLQVVRAIYDPLTIPDGKGGYVPYLAKTLTHDPTFKVWTLTLHSGVTFHDGEPLTAQVVKDNLDAFRGVPGNHKRASLLFAFQLKNIIGVEVVNDLTVQITTQVPQPALPGMLYSSGRLGMMAPKQLNASPEDCADDPIGTGPFRFVDWKPGERLLTARNPDYWVQAPDGQPYPYLDSIEFRPMPNNDERIAALREGTINMLHTSSVADMVGSLAVLRDAGEINLLVSNTQTESVYSLFNTSVPGLDDRETRVAAAQAVDRAKLNDLGNAGFANVLDGPFGPGVLGYLKDNGYPAYDPAAAKRTVARLKAEGKRTSFTLLTPENPANLRLAGIAQSMLKDAGFDIRLEVISEADLVQRVIAGDYEVAAFRNHPGEDPDLNYVWWYGEANPVNFGRFNDPVINDNLDLGRSATDPNVRRKAYEAVNRQFGSEVWNLWLFQTPWAVAEAATVHGILGPPLDAKTPAPPRIVTGHPLIGIWIDP